ncbi:MAG TPA: hypothetical protein VFH61_05670 [Thermoleophilia bacterium]|nr:hypothetical protein [Thermoleophilia bacterium]
MADVGAALHAHLIADGTLTALLGTYVGVAAIFTDTVPETPPARYIVISPVVTTPELSTKNTAGRTEVLDVACYDATGDDDSTTVLAIAERVAVLVERVKVTVPGLTPIKGAHLGTITNDGPEILGRVVQVEMGFSD